MIRPSRGPFGPNKTNAAKSSGAGRLMRQVKHKVLDNGLRVFLVESHELPVVCHMVWYTVGSRDEKTGETGLSHFIEHMMFKGTTDFPKGSIDLVTARLGGHNNAFTNHDCTAYYFNLKSDRWVQALEIEASRMRDCLLDPVEFEAEKRVVLEELQMGEDDPWRPLFQGVEAVAYKVHPYRHPIIGWRQDLERLTRERMLDYYRRHYAPDRAILVVVGDFKRKQAFDLIEEHLGGIPPSGAAREAVLAEPPQDGERRLTIHAGNLPRLAIAWHTCSVGAPDDPVLDLVSCILSNGKTARFYRSLVQGRELAAFVHAYNEARFDPGLFWVLAEGRPDTDHAKLERGVLDEIQRLRSDGPSPAELKRAKKQILTSFYFELETVGSQAQRLGTYEVSCQDGYKVLERYSEALAKVTAKKIKDALGRYFVDRNRTVGWSLPVEAS